jgi:hypothetical protein
MQTTTKQHWQNGHSVRGNHFHALAWQLGPIGFLLCWQLKDKKYFNFEAYKLV